MHKNMLIVDILRLSKSNHRLFKKEFEVEKNKQGKYYLSEQCQNVSETFQFYCQWKFELILLGFSRDYSGLWEQTFGRKSSTKYVVL